MLTIMDMAHGEVISDEGVLKTEFGRYREQVLNAEWVPSYPELQPLLPRLATRLEEQPQKSAKFSPVMDVDAFLAAMYRNQR